MRHGARLAHGGKDGDERTARHQRRPLPAAGEGRSAVDPQIRVGFAELPGSSRVFNLSSRAWDNRADDDDPRVPLLAVAGRLGVVAAKSDHRDAAFQLLLWLSDGRMSPQVSAASPATTLFCRAHLKSPSLWVEKPVSAAAAVQYGDATEAALRHEQWLGALRLPGRAEYLAALDEAVAAAVRGKKSPLDALLAGRQEMARDHRAARPGSPAGGLSPQPGARIAPVAAMRPNEKQKPPCNWLQGGPEWRRRASTLRHVVNEYLNKTTLNQVD